MEQEIGARTPTLSLRQVSKQYVGVTVLSGVDLDVHAGEALALAGQNGAGKSTLVKIICGDEHPSEGEIFLGGERVEFRSPQEAQRAGIATIHQEITLVPRLTVAENLCLSRVPTSHGLVDRNELFRVADESIKKLGFKIDVRASAESLSVAQQQVVLIAKALHQDARVLLLDEPTAALSVPDAERLFTLLDHLKARGAALLYISHRLDEMYRICDRIMILRDGRHISTHEIDKIDRKEVVRQVIGGKAVGAASAIIEGRQIGGTKPKAADETTKLALEITGLNDGGLLNDVSIRIERGESVAVTGLVGSGSSELGACLFGNHKRTSGKVYVNGREIKAAKPRAMIRAGVGWVPDDRKTQGLVLGMDVGQNISMANLPAIAPRGVLQRSIEQTLARSVIGTLGIKTRGPGQRAETLSGGNQQKVVVGKWLAAGAKLLLMSEPTRGVDVGAREDIYREVHDFVSQGGAVVMFTSDIEEALICDRLYVMARGRVVGEFERGAISLEEIMRLVA